MEISTWLKGAVINLLIVKQGENPMQQNMHFFQYPMVMLLAGSALFAPICSFACDTDPYVGSVCIVAGSYCPRGYAEAQGQVLAITDYQMLYAQIGTTYGGNGTSTFGLPDLRGRSAVGLGLGTGLMYNITLGEKRGYEGVSMSLANLPAHSHSATFTPSGTNPVVGQMQVSTSDGTDTTPKTDQYLGASAVSGMATPSNIYTDDGSDLVDINGLTVSGGSVSGTVIVGSTGTGNPAYNIPPQLGLRYCIATSGIWPPRP